MSTARFTTPTIGGHPTPDVVRVFTVAGDVVAATDVGGGQYDVEGTTGDVVTCLVTATNTIGGNEYEWQFLFEGVIGEPEESALAFSNPAMEVRVLTYEETLPDIFIIQGDQQLDTVQFEVLE